MENKLLKSWLRFLTFAFFLHFPDFQRFNGTYSRDCLLQAKSINGLGFHYLDHITNLTFRTENYLQFGLQFKLKFDSWFCAVHLRQYVSEFLHFVENILMQRWTQVLKHKCVVQSLWVTVYPSKGTLYTNFPKWL
jgi:hypothetical protein